MPEELDEQSLFNDVTSDEPAETPIIEPVTEEPEKEPARDEAGRYAKAEEPPVDITGQKPVIDDNAPQVPSWRVREINDEKRALAEKLTALETERNQWLAERQRLTAKEQPAEQPAKPDPLLDPVGYEKHIEKIIEDRLLNNHRETDLRITRSSNAETFDKAYAESQRLKFAGDPAFLELSQKMNSTTAPGKVLLDWYQQRTTQAEIGGDLNAYKQKLRDEALKDPEFQKAALAAWREQAPSQSNGRPRVDLPPSLNGASRSNSMLRSQDGDIPDTDLWNQVTGTG